MEDLIFDARPFQAAGQEPFAYIMRAVNQLYPGQAFTLINTFDPRPLEVVMEARGYRYTVRQEGPEHFVVRFTRDPALKPGDVPILDRRGEPLDRVLLQLASALKKLKIGEQFRVRLSEAPGLQIRVVKKVGALVDVEPDGNGGVILLITRAHPVTPYDRILPEDAL